MSYLPDPTPQRVLAAVRQVAVSDGVDVSVFDKAKILQKFGRNPDIDNGGYKTVWNGQAINDEPPNFPATGNTIDTIVSEDAGDDQTIYIEGHTISGDDLSFTSQTVTLNGQTEVALTTSMHTVTRAYNSDTTEFTGPVHIFDNADGSTAGVPTDPTDTAAYMPGGNTGQQTQLGFTAISSVDYLFITEVTAAVNRQANTAVDVILQKKSTTGVWRPVHLEIGVHTQGATTVTIHPDPAIIVPNNCYVRFIAQGSSASATTVACSFGGYLASIIT